MYTISMQCLTKPAAQSCCIKLNVIIVR